MADSRVRTWLPYLLVAPGAILLVAFVGYPLLSSMWISLRNADLSAWVGVTNYMRVFRDATFWHALRVTGVFVGIGVPVSVLLGFLLALSIWNTRVMFEGFFRTVFMLPITVTPVIVGVMWKWILNPTFGVLNHYLKALGLGEVDWFGSPSLALGTVIAIDVWQYTPFIFVTLLAALRTLPKDPFESAKIDGASGWQSLIYITIPLLRPVLLVVVMFRLFMALRAFDVIYVATNGGPGRATSVVNLYIYQQGLQFFNSGYASALAIVLFALSVPVMWAFVRGSKHESW